MLLRERLGLFLTLEEWAIFKTSILEGKDLERWHIDWLTNPDRTCWLTNYFDPLRCEVNYPVRTNDPKHWDLQRIEIE
jgi:hypothetical protein